MSAILYYMATDTKNTQTPVTEAQEPKEGKEANCDQYTDLVKQCESEFM